MKIELDNLSSSVSHIRVNPSLSNQQNAIAELIQRIDVCKTMLKKAGDDMSSLEMTNVEVVKIKVEAGKSYTAIFQNNLYELQTEFNELDDYLGLLKRYSLVLKADRKLLAQLNSLIIDVERFKQVEIDIVTKIEKLTGKFAHLKGLMDDISNLMVLVKSANGKIPDLQENNVRVLKSNIAKAVHNEVELIIKNQENDPHEIGDHRLV